jgi:hypothetical protein
MRAISILLLLLTSCSAPFGRESGVEPHEQKNSSTPLAQKIAMQLKPVSSGVYRTYAYLNPDDQRWPEAKQMLRIASILYTGFSIER